MATTGDCLPRRREGGFARRASADGSALTTRLAARRRTRTGDGRRAAEVTARTELLSARAELATAAGAEAKAASRSTAQTASTPASARTAVRCDVECSLTLVGSAVEVR